MSTIGLMLDLQALQCPHFSERGIARYVASHAGALLEQPEVVRRMFLHPMFPLPVRLPAAIRLSSLLCWKTASEIRAARTAGPAALYMMSPFHAVEGSLTQYPPADIPLIATLYDLIPLLHPEQYLQRERDRTLYMARADILRRADLLLSISESARDDAIAHLGVSPDAVVNIGTGIDARFKPLAPGETLPAEARKSIGIDGPYVMAVLGDDNRKNLVCLLKAMTRLSVGRHAGIQLVVVGNYSEQTIQRYRQMPSARALGERLVFAGRVPDHFLVNLYQGALLHVFPSLYEGFGLPAAEAAGCGCPSIMSNTSSLPEVLHLPEATFDPTDEDEMAALISRTIVDTTFRDMLVERGLHEAGKHTWERVAHRTVDAVAAADAAGRFQHRMRLRSRLKPRIGLVGPMPPARSGIADYNERICRELQRHCRLDLFLSHPDAEQPPTLYGCRCYPARALRDLLDPYAYDALIYTFGNSEHHQETVDLCREFPGWVWLHEVRFYGLFCCYANERLGVGQAAGFLQYSLARQYSTRMPLLMDSADAANPHYLRERDVGLTDLLMRHARGIILHSAHAERMLRHDLPPGMALPPVSCIPLAFPYVASDSDRTFTPPWLIGHFGIVDPIKHPMLLITAFARLRQTSAQLVFVGSVEETLRAELEALATGLGVGGRVTFAGMVSAEAYQDWLRKVDIAVQLRAISNGESSAAIHDAVAAGIPVVTNMPYVEQWPIGSVCRISASPTVRELHAAMVRILEPETLKAQSAAGLALARENTAGAVTLRLLEAIGISVADATGPAAGLQNTELAGEYAAPLRRGPGCFMPPSARHADGDMRMVITSTPRSGNTWLRRLLGGILDLEEYAVHNPDDLDWDALPRRCIVQIHWLPTETFLTLLHKHGFHIIVLARHPLDVLASILHFAPHMERPFRWLEGMAGDESSLLDASPHSKELLAYATGPRFAALLSVSQLWWQVDGVVRVRYEDLVAKPQAALHALCEAVGFKAERGVISGVLAENSMEAINRTFNKRHCWKGQPGTWKTILTESEAARIAAAHPAVFLALGYQCDPDVRHAPPS